LLLNFQFVNKSVNVNLFLLFNQRTDAFFCFHGTIALLHTRRVGLCVWAFAAGWQQCGVQRFRFFFYYFFVVV
jgi:hypothetical protein